MLGCTLLALSAVTIGLWLTGTELNISSMMGMTMIVGIATEVAVFYVSELVSLPDDLPRHEAFLQADSVVVGDAAEVVEAADGCQVCAQRQRPVGGLRLGWLAGEALAEAG